jgi:hypothetical protein
MHFKQNGQIMYELIEGGGNPTGAGTAQSV